MEHDARELEIRVSHEDVSEHEINTIVYEKQEISNNEISVTQKSYEIPAADQENDEIVKVNEENVEMVAVNEENVERIDALKVRKQDLEGEGLLEASSFVKSVIEEAQSAIFETSEISEPVETSVVKDTKVISETDTNTTTESGKPYIAHTANTNNIADMEENLENLENVTRNNETKNNEIVDKDNNEPILLQDAEQVSLGNTKIQNNISNEIEESDNETPSEVKKLDSVILNHINLVEKVENLENENYKLIMAREVIEKANKELTDEIQSQQLIIHNKNLGNITH